MREFARSVARRLRRLRSANFEDRTRPLSRSSGFDRGKPIDRHYIDLFLAEHAADIHGSVLEVGSDVYSKRFGGTRISRQEILHIDDSNPAATIVGDLSSPGLLPSATFDCVILTQTLQYVFDVPAAISQLRDALRPGGVLLLTVPGVAPVSLDPWQDSYYWRFTDNAVERLLAREFDGGSTEVRPFGNLYAATAFLHGAAVEEVDAEKLIPSMPEYAILIAARVVA